MIDWRPVCLQMFAKCPGNGNPKTRLQPPLTKDEASELHMRLASRTLATLRAASGKPPVLWLDRASDHPWVRQQQSTLACEIRVQVPGDLGARMSHAIYSGLSKHPITILVGSDCPVLEAHHLRQVVAAFADDNDAVFIPAEDGGYVLIALRRHHPALFSNIRWGGDEVLAHTCEILSILGWRWATLERLWDVDTPADLERMIHEGIELPSLYDIYSQNYAASVCQV